MPDIVIQIGMCLDAYDQQLGGNARKFFVDQVAKLISQAAKDVNNNSPLYAGISPEIPVVDSICFDNTERLGVTLVNNIGLRDANGHTPFDRAEITEAVQPIKGAMFSVQVTPDGLNRVINAASGDLQVDYWRGSD